MEAQTEHVNLPGGIPYAISPPQPAPEIYDFETEFDEIKKLEDMTEGAETHEGQTLVVGVDGNVGIGGPVIVEGNDIDGRSVYVGNVDYSSTPAELQEHFKSCGQINRITILVDKYSGHPKGFAYMEFANEDGMKNSLLLNNTLFKDRQIKVIPKRHNIPGFNRGRGGYRGRPGRVYRLPTFRGRGSFRPHYRPRGYRRGFGRPY